MPFCETCARHWTPPSLRADGTCPTCGAQVGSSDPAATTGAGTGTEARSAAAPSAPLSEAAPSSGCEVRNKVPWHFTLLLIALVLYLGFRAYQGIAWLVVHVF